MAMIFMPLPRFVLPTSSPPPLAGTKVASMKHSDSLPKRIGKIYEHIPQDFTATPLLETSVHSFVVRIALRQHVPLRTRVQNPQDGFQYAARRNRLTSGAAFWNMFFRKMIPDAFPLVIAQT
jgi:hypothetical protein